MLLIACDAHVLHRRKNAGSVRRQLAMTTAFISSTLYLSLVSEITHMNGLDSYVKTSFLA